MARPARVNLDIDTRDFQRGMKKLSEAMKRFGAAIPRVHTLDPASPIHDQLALDFLMRARAEAIRAEAKGAPFVRRLYLRSVARGLTRKPMPYREFAGGRSA